MATPSLAQTSDPFESGPRQAAPAKKKPVARPHSAPSSSNADELNRSEQQRIGVFRDAVSGEEHLGDAELRLGDSLFRRAIGPLRSENGVAHNAIAACIFDGKNILRRTIPGFRCDRVPSFPCRADLRNQSTARFSSWEVPLPARYVARCSRFSGAVKISQQSQRDPAHRRMAHTHQDPRGRGTASFVSDAHADGVQLRLTPIGRPGQQRRIELSDAPNAKLELLEDVALVVCHDLFGAFALSIAPDNVGAVNSTSRAIFKKSFRESCNGSPVLGTVASIATSVVPE
jgi:hypothetical protein